ncbi:MAG: DUF4202 family protein [Deltaproteobacteria bacterium]|nr:DUF4202 family protein [Deltaproteobacteria bacterium]
MIEKRQNQVYLAAVGEFVERSFAAAGNRLVPLHLKRTVDWLRKLHPAADEALLVAGMAHDLERAFREEEVYARMFRSAGAFRDPAFLEYHQRRSAEITDAYLAARGCPAPMRTKIFHLINHHEVGGDPESDLLKDADSLSFFTTNVEMFVTVKTRESSPAKVRDKFAWMYERISSPTARRRCRSLYEAALARLDEFVAAGEPAETNGKESPP